MSERPKPCPYCGRSVDLGDPDTLHPATPPDRDGRQVWGFSCPEAAGGCGAMVTGWSRAEAMVAWERREGDATQRVRQLQAEARLSDILVELLEGKVKRLEAENARLREALTTLADHCERVNGAVPVDLAALEIGHDKA